MILLKASDFEMALHASVQFLPQVVEIAEKYRIDADLKAWARANTITPLGCADNPIVSEF